METGRLLIKIQGLLMHSLSETQFYDRATDQILAPELKSAFAKYLWLRGEHIVGIKTFLIGSHSIQSATYRREERIWRFFSDCIAQRDNPAIWSTGLRYLRFTRYKYADTLRNQTGESRLGSMLQNHLTDIETFLHEFSALKVNSQHPYAFSVSNNNSSQ